MNAPPSVRPFAIFFPLAAIDAIFVGCAWMAAAFGLTPFGTAGEIVNWHARELLFGFVPAVLSGFFLTALPRWTGQPIDPRVVRALAFLWLASRLAPPAVLAPLSALPAAVLAVVAAIHVAAARDRRNIATVLLLTLYSLSSALALAPATQSLSSLATRAAIVAMLGLVALIGGRILPALSARFDALEGSPSSRTPDPMVERLAVLSLAVALGFWLCNARGAAASAVLTAAGAAQVWRMSGWAGRRLGESSALIALFAGYSCLPAGFFALAVHAAIPGAIPAAAGLHIWTVGCFGGMILAVMSSMIRKRSALAFVESRAGRGTSLLWGAALLCRIAAEFAPAPAFWLAAASAAWTGAFALFLFEFRRPLFSRA
jgi:uncharacterized protein involved in response to NO